ncbi:MAG: chemotaxis protein CheW [Bacteroidota bacterium]|nr:chemotaxis protein CheW [Bacteroidota bacterium]
MELEENKKASTELLQLVSFTLGNEEFGIEIQKVQEIIRMVEITKLPNSPDFVEGIMNLRGKVIPVICLRQRLGLEKLQADKNTRVIVVNIIGKTIGFIVDSVSEVLRIPRDLTEKPPEITTGINTDYIVSIARLEDRLLILLDLDRTLLTTEKIELEALGS